MLVVHCENILIVRQAKKGAGRSSGVIKKGGADFNGIYAKTMPNSTRHYLCIDFKKFRASDVRKDLKQQLMESGSIQPSLSNLVLNVRGQLHH